MAVWQLGTEARSHVADTLARLEVLPCRSGGPVLCLLTPVT